MALLIIWILLIAVSYSMIVSCFASDHSDQIRVFSNKIDKVIFGLADLLLFGLLWYYVEVMLILFCVYEISVFSTAVNIMSGAIVIPIMNYIAKIPIIKAEVTNNKFAYNQKSVLELDISDDINIRAINNNEDPQAIKFIGFCQNKYVDSIGMKEDGFDKHILPFQYNSGEENIIETVAPHSESHEYNKIAVSEVILPLLSSEGLNESKLIKTSLNKYTSSEIIEALINEGALTTFNLADTLLSEYTLSEIIELTSEQGTIFNLIEKLVTDYSSSEIIQKLIKRDALNISKLLKILINNSTSTEIIQKFIKQDELAKTIGTLTKFEKKQKQVFMDAIYENEDGNYFFKPFNVKIDHD